MKIFFKITLVAILVSVTFSQTDIPTEKVEPVESVVPTPPISLSSTGTILLDRVIDAEQYIVGPGDKFRIDIMGPVKTIAFLTITPTGKISIPEVGAIDLRDMTLAQSTQAIQELISGSIYGATISVDLLGVREFKVLVYGAVKNPGYYNVNPISRIYEIGQLAGVKRLADLTAIQTINAKGDTLSHDWFKFLEQGDLKQNPSMLEGEKLYIPFTDFANSVIAVRGAAESAGYYVLNPPETIFSFLNRTIDLQEVADINSIYVYRKARAEYQEVFSDDFDQFLLSAGDVLELLRVEPIRVNGYVSIPGVFTFVPGHSALDYIALAGGALPNGNVKNIEVIRQQNAIEYKSDTILLPGDIIEVKRTYSDILFGKISILQFITSTATIVLSYLAITTTT